jgi:hypothetical protein
MLPGSSHLMLENKETFFIANHDVWPLFVADEATTHFRSDSGILIYQVRNELNLTGRRVSQLKPIQDWRETV